MEAFVIVVIVSIVLVVALYLISIEDGKKRKAITKLSKMIIEYDETYPQLTKRETVNKAREIRAFAAKHNLHTRYSEEYISNEINSK